MARAVERIEQEIAALEQSLGAIAAELGSSYQSYLIALGNALQQQLILATYYLCTQGYPSPFLSLSFNQRQQLQQAIRKLGKNAAEALKLKMEGTEVPSPSNPMLLAQWQQSIEAAIVQTLKAVSRDTNHLLQQAGILPEKLPEQLLEAAAKAEAAAETIAGPPHLLNLAIETENPAESATTTITQIIAIHLRLAEIEFADATVRSHRHQIRNLLLKVNSLVQEYHKKQKEWTIAQAEAAWRASWFED